MVKSTKNQVTLRTKDKDNRPLGGVKSLISEFEVNRKDRTRISEVHNMGAEQSFATEPQNNASGLVRQRISQFNSDFNSESSSDKRKSYKFANEAVKNPARDFRRTKSSDGYPNKKDWRSVSRQAVSKIESSAQIPCNDTNNNIFKKNNKSKISHLPLNKVDKEQHSTNNMLTERYLDNKNLYSDLTPRNSMRNSKNKGVKSVKSIKKMFEVKLKAQNENTLELLPSVISNFTDKEKSPLLNTQTSNHKLSDPLNGEFENFKNKVVDGDEENLRINNNAALENLRKSIWVDIIDVYHGTKSEPKNEFSESDQDFSQIENTLQEMEQTIKEIKENHPDFNLFVKSGADCEVTDSADELENIDIYMYNCKNPNKVNDEFGERSFGSRESIDFVEAYNKVGDELVVTKVATVEHKSLNESDRGNKIEEHCSSTEDVDIFLKLQSNKADSDTSLEKYEGIDSNRSTLYTNTDTNSAESLNTIETDDELKITTNNLYENILENNVEIPKIPNNISESTIKTETYYDSFQNPRIAKVSKIHSEEQLAQATLLVTHLKETAESLENGCSIKTKKDYIIEELIDTEKRYIKHLQKVVKDYMTVINDDQLPHFLEGKSVFLFENIETIYNATKQFYKALKNCGNNHEEIAKVFLRYKNLFELYPLYSKNKPTADQYLLNDFKNVVSAREKQLNDRLGLASHLLTPIQRLGKYILFLEQIQKELVKNGMVASDNIYKAIEVVRKEMTRGNDYIAIDSILDSPVNLLKQGSLIMRDNFNIIKPKKYEAMLFLFEEMLIFTTIDVKNPKMFVFKDCIRLNEMGIIIFEDHPLIFHLKKFHLNQKGFKEYQDYVIEAKKSKDKKAWTEQIEKRLWDQLVKCKEKQFELHSSKEKRNSMDKLPDRSKKKNAGYSSLPTDIHSKSSKSVFYY